MSGDGVGELVDGTVYGALRYDRENYPLRTKRGVNEKFVYTIIDGLINALERKTGRVVWSEPLGEIAATDLDYSKERWKWEHENKRSRRFAATNETVVVQGSKGMVARRAENGKLLWLVKTELDESTTDPVILKQTVLAVSLQDCSIFALDVNDGRELWRVKVPDCNYFYIFDD